MKNVLFPSLLFLLIGTFIAVRSQEDLRQLHDKNLDKSAIHEELYLPSGEGLKLFSVGFKNVLADILWFRTINYFGREFASNKDYRFLIHYINLVVDLNPRMDFVYQFGSMMFAWELNQPKESIALLTKGITALPNNWLLRYYRGFMYFFFLNDSDHAQQDLMAASHLPNAHPMVTTLAEKISRNQLSNQQILSTLSETTRDDSLKAFLKSKQR